MGSKICHIAAGLTVDVVKGKEGQNSISFSICTTVPTQLLSLSCRKLEGIGDDVSVTQHDSLRHTGSPRRIDQECQIRCRPSPQAGELLLKPGPSLLRGRPPSLTGPVTGERGPLRSQLPKSRTFPSDSKLRRAPARSLPASERLSRLRPKVERSGTRRGGCSGAGKGPLRVQSSSLTSRSLAVGGSQFSPAHRIC